METRAQTVDRLLTAFEDLAAQETLLLRAEDYPAVLSVQQRVAPLVDRLTALGGAAGVGGRERIAAVCARRRQSEAWLAAALVRRRDELRQTRTTERRLALVRPAYGAAASGGQRLQARG